MREPGDPAEGGAMRLTPEAREEVPGPADGRAVTRVAFADLPKGGEADGAMTEPVNGAMAGPAGAVERSERAADRLAGAREGAWDRDAADDLMLAREIRRRYDGLDAQSILRTLTNRRDREAGASDARKNPEIERDTLTEPGGDSAARASRADADGNATAEAPNRADESGERFDVDSGRSVGTDSGADSGTDSDEPDGTGDEVLAGEPALNPVAIDEIRRNLERAREREAVRAEFVRSLLKQEGAVRLEHPDFNLVDAIEASPAFRALILAGEPVGRALDYLRPEEAMARAEQRVAERIRRRNAAPLPMTSSNGRAGGLNPADMSEAQLRAIDEKLKRGERVYIH